MKAVARRVWALVRRRGCWDLVVVACTVAALVGLSKGSQAGGVPELFGAPPGAPARPPCPPGWTNADNPAAGLLAYVPPGFRVKTPSGMFAVDRVGQPPATAYMVPFAPAQRVTPQQLAQMFAQFAAGVEPTFRSQFAGPPGPEQASVAYTMMANGQPIEGRYTAVVTPDGRAAWIIGVSAAQGRLAAEMPVLSTIARSLGLTRPTLKWVDYRSPGNSMTLKVPAGFTVETTEGVFAKNEVDWWAYHPSCPGARAFSMTIKYCSPNLVRGLPLHEPQNGYKPMVFQDPRACIQAALSELKMQVQVTSMTPNQPLTKLFNQFISTAAQSLRSLGVGDFRISVYDCEGAAQAGGHTLQFSFCAAIAQLTMAGSGIEQWVWCRGWFAPAEQAALFGPILEKIMGSFEYTPEYMARVFKAEGERAQYMRSVYRYMAKVDREIAESHWKTNDAIAHMMYDVLTDRGGYSNPNTNKIESDEVKNSRGEVVSAEEVRGGTHPDNATVLTPAFSKEYEQAGGRTPFSP